MRYSIVLRYLGLWDAVKGQVRSFRERYSVGRALEREDEGKLLDAISEPFVKNDGPELLAKI